MKIGIFPRSFVAQRAKKVPRVQESRQLRRLSTKRFKLFKRQSTTILRLMFLLQGGSGYQLKINIVLEKHQEGRGNFLSEMAELIESAKALSP